MTFSVIIPAMNEQATLPSCLAAVRRGLPGCEILVVDGGSTDATIRIADEAGVTVLTGARGRGSQMNYGARQANGEILLFLHADTVVPQEVLECLRTAFADPDLVIAAFRAQFSPSSPVLRFYSFFTRFDSPLTTFGDQCLVLRSDFFRSLGGYREWPLFEDVDILRRARKTQRVRKLPLTVHTSSRRFIAGGPLVQQARNVWTISRFYFGTPAEELASAYYDSQEGRGETNSGWKAEKRVTQEEQP